MMQIETDPKLKLAVFDSAVPAFLLTHYDFRPPLEQTVSMALRPTGLPLLLDMLVRPGRGPVVLLVSARGQAIGIGSELILASDIRFAGCEKAVLSRLESGAGFVPGGGPMARLPRRVGRGRALEILLSGNDSRGPLKETDDVVERRERYARPWCMD
jgi:enoyl-CoA hydratase/carnithine racemase